MSLSEFSRVDILVFISVLSMKTLHLDIYLQSMLLETQPVNLSIASVCTSKPENQFSEPRRKNKNPEVLMTGVNTMSDHSPYIESLDIIGK